MVGAGVLHLTTQREEFRTQVPAWFPVDEDLTVLGSGVVEIALGGAFLTLPQHRRTVGVLAVHRIRRRSRALADDVAVLRILSTLIGQLLQLRALVESSTRRLAERNALLERALESAAARYGIVGTSPGPVGTARILSTTSMPSTTRPNTA